MEQYQQRHARPAKPLVHRHLLARRDGESDRLCVTVEKVHVARPSGERTGRGDSVADVLNSFRSVARNQSARGLVVKTERGNAIVLTVKDAGLAVGRGGRQSAEPASQNEALIREQLADCRAITLLQRSLEVRKREGVDLKHDQAAAGVVWTALARKCAVLQRVVAPQ